MHLKNNLLFVSTLLVMGLITGCSSSNDKEGEEATVAMDDETVVQPTNEPGTTPGTETDPETETETDPETEAEAETTPETETVVLDLDNDGTDDAIDNCPDVMNEGQADGDGDGLGDACDTTVNIQVGDYEFVNDGNGAVTEITDLEDATAVSIVQTVPILDDSSPSSIDTPITLFFDDKLLLDSLFNNISVSQNGEQIPGTVTITESSNGFAILTFSPVERYQEGSTVALTLAGGNEGLKDDGGNPLAGNQGDGFEILITTIDTNVAAFDNNLSFESFDDGVIFSGDGAVQTGSFGCLAATDGSNFAAISTGSSIVSGGVAVGDTSSTMQIGPINIDPDQASISFDFNFVSGEFNEFVGTIFDDSSVFSITGPDGTTTEVLTTVNLTGTEGNTDCSSIGALVNEFLGDDYAGQTGWINRTVNVNNLGSPLFITLTVTDVEDTNLTTILAIDNIRF